jgi:HAD superfamily hydrolase (TIGR01549 family)
MLTTILFDLDNTLILFDETEFYYRYLNPISEAFQDLIPKDVFKKRLMIASQALLQNNGKLINSDYYMNVFCEGFKNKRDLCWNRFVKFYENGFDQFQQLMQPIPGILELFNYLKEANFKLVIASNPLFPLIVQLKRLSWAGFENFQFDLITHIENTKYCKPQLGYYLEICEQLNEKPENCLMVGNDPVNDMIASKVGMKTYFTTDSLHNDDSSLNISQTIRKNHQNENGIKIDFQGPIFEIKKILKKLNGSN